MTNRDERRQTDADEAAEAEAAEQGRLREAEHDERWQLLRSLDSMMEGPLVVLAFVWLGVLLLEFVIGTDARLDLVFYSIWLVFIADVVVKLLIAPSRRAWLRGNWLKLISLAIPALRLLRVFTALGFLRAAGTIRSASMLRLVTSLNRGIGALGRTLDQTGFAYVLAISALVIVIGAAGMLFFEAPAALPVPGGGAQIASYGEALWWTAMTMTTVGTQYEPVSSEGRLLGWLLSVYAIGVFGYVTATIASHFLGLGRPVAETLGGAELTAELTAELHSLREEIVQLRTALITRSGAGGPAA